MSNRYVFTEQGVAGEECFNHLDRQSHRYWDTQHAYNNRPAGNKVLVNLCPECAGDKSRQVEPATKATK